MTAEAPATALRVGVKTTTRGRQSGIADAHRGALGFVTAFVLRYGWAGICAAAMAGADVAVLLMRGSPWRGDLLWTLDWIPIAFVIVGPVVAGFVAVDTARLGAGSSHLGGASWRTPAAGVAAGYAAMLTVVHVVVVLGAVVVSRPPRIDGSAWLAVLVQVAMVWFFIAVGSLVGRFSSPVLAGIVAALAGIATVFLLSTSGRHVVLLYGGAATVPRIGFAYDPTYLLFQLGVLLLVIAALSVLRTRGDGGLRSVRPRLVGLAIFLLCGATVLAFQGPGQRLRPVAAAPSSCGAVVTVPVCVYPEHRRVVEAFDTQLWALFNAAQIEGYDALVPSRVVEASQTSWESGPEVGSIYVNSDNLSGSAPTMWQVALDLVQPLQCDGLRGEAPPRDKYWEDLNALTGTWVMLVDPALGELNGYYGKPLSPAEAAELMEQFRTCTYPFA